MVFSFSFCLTFSKMPSRSTYAGTKVKISFFFWLNNILDFLKTEKIFYIDKSMDKFSQVFSFKLALIFKLFSLLIFFSLLSKLWVDRTKKSSFLRKKRYRIFVLYVYNYIIYINSIDTQFLISK